MDKSKFSQAAFRSGKSPESNALRLCYEIRSFVHDSEQRKNRSSLAKYMDRVEHILIGDHKLSKHEDSKVKIASVFIQDKILECILTNITILELEISRHLFNIMLLSAEVNFQEHIIANINSISMLLITPVSSLDLDLLCGQFLRDLMQYQSIFGALLNVNVFNLLVQVACDDIFEISSDACVSIRLLLDTEDAQDFINQNHLEVLQGLYVLCDAGYYTKRVALTLLYTLLQNNENLKEAYVTNEENLKYVMLLMRQDESVEVKIEAFFLFALQVRVLCESKKKSCLPGYKIIVKNQEKLITFLEKFYKFREDHKFQQEKTEIIELLSEHYYRAGLQKLP